MDLNRGTSAQRILIVAFANELEACFVDRAGAERLRVAGLKRMLRLQRVVTDSWQAEGPDAIAVLIVAPILVARRKSISGSDLIIEPLTEIRPQKEC